VEVRAAREAKRQYSFDIAQYLTAGEGQAGRPEPHHSSSSDKANHIRLLAVR
jgi:hypothetical protein